MHIVRISLSDEAKAALDALCNREERTMSVVIKRLLLAAEAAFQEIQKTPAQRLGLP